MWRDAVLFACLIVMLLVSGCWYLNWPTEDVPPPAATEEVSGPCLLYAEYDDVILRLEPSRLTAALIPLEQGRAYPVLRHNEDFTWYLVDADQTTGWAGVPLIRLEGDCSRVRKYEAGDGVPTATEEAR